METTPIKTATSAIAGPEAAEVGYNPTTQTRPRRVSSRVVAWYKDVERGGPFYATWYNSIWWLSVTYTYNEGKRTDAY